MKSNKSMQNFLLNIKTIISITTISCFILITQAKSQSKNDILINNDWAKSPIQIDGNLNDWQDSLTHRNESMQISYNLKNDGKKLYMAIKSHNKQNLNRIIARGISFSFNTEGQKKPGETIIFPVFDRVSQPKKPVTVPPAQAEKQLLSRITRLFVTGFSGIKDGPVSLNNTYGISAAAGFDGKGQLIIEVAIPFDELKINGTPESIACLIEINGIRQPKTAFDPNRNSARRDRFGNPNRDYRFDRQPAIDKQSLATGFWFKSNLAKNPN